ncbi:MAG: T9SS type A sorting domain-containing protein, partial [Fidelibacterota bacterium]
WEDEGQHYAKVVVEDCEFARNRLRAIHTDDNNTMDTLIVKNCFFEEIGEYAIYRSYATRSVEVAIITGNTFYKLGGGGVRLNNVGELVVTNNTFFFGDSSLTNRSVIGVRAQNDTVTTIRDNIFASFDYKGVEVYGPDPTVEYNLFMDCGINVINDDDTTMTFPYFNIEGDPIFKDTSAATLDLAVEVNGDAIGNASDGGNLGDPRWGTWTLSSVDDRGGELPIAYALHQNYPNPFNPSTTIRFDVAAAGHASLKVYDLLGREIVTLLDQVMEPGYHTITWNAEGLTSGIYFYRIQVNDFVKNRKLVILK